MKKLSKKQVSQIRKLLLTQKGAVNRQWGLDALKYVEQLLAGHKVHFLIAGSRGKRSTFRHAAGVARDVVEAMGYEIIVANDAPRGGELGGHYVKPGRVIKFDRAEFLAAIGGAL